MEGHEEAGKLGYWSTLTRDVCALLGYRSSYVLNWSYQYRLATSSDVVRAGHHVPYVFGDLLDASSASNPITDSSYAYAELRQHEPDRRCPFLVTGGY